MKNYENEDIIIQYNDIDEKHIDSIIESLSNRTKTIMTFFKLKYLTKKVKIVIWGDNKGYLKP